MGFILTDVNGLELTQEERELVTHPAIAGIILFSRNYHDLDQLKALTHSIKQLNPKIFIVADQEGGRVQRFRSHFTMLPSMREWANRFQLNPTDTVNELKKTTATMVSELQRVNVDASLVPVLDIDYGVSEIISDRSFGADANLIKTLADIVIETLHANGMPCTGKHFPGHGAVHLDSHKELPVDTRPLDKIIESDTVPYQYFINRLDAIMPAHVVYSKADDKPAGFSRFWLQEILRDKLGYKGMILSDDVSMQAAQHFGDYPTRAQLALEAGCDVVSICNNRAGTVQVLDQLGAYYNEASQKRLATFRRRH